MRTRVTAFRRPTAAFCMHGSAVPHHNASSNMKRFRTRAQHTHPRWYSFAAVGMNGLSSGTSSMLEGSMQCPRASYNASE